MPGRRIYKRGDFKDEFIIIVIMSVRNWQHSIGDILITSEELATTSN